MTEASPPRGDGLLRLVPLLGGVVLASVVLALPAPEGMAIEAWRVVAVTALMVTWWIGEAVPVAATALVPVVAFPLLRVAPLDTVTAAYAHPLIFLFLGGFLLAVAFERWNLHRRIALAILGRVGTRPIALVGGFMAATALLSMWISNTATTVMMLPIGLSVIALVEQRGKGGDGGNFAVALLLGIAYAASIGGLGTLIGTPPNALVAAFLAESQGISVGFVAWLPIGLPLVALLLPAAWLALTRLAFPVPRGAIPGAAQTIALERAAMGRLTTPEARVALVFGATALLWVLRPVIAELVPGLPLSDSAIAILGALMLFVIPAGGGRATPLLTWDWAKRIPWGVLLLFGGGLGLATAFSESGLAAWIAASLEALRHWPQLAVVLVVVAIVVFLTEIMSNTAAAAIFFPVIAALAQSMGMLPAELLVPVALAASCAFMMPIATPPNAIVFGSERLSHGQMARAGLLLNILVIALIPLWVEILLRSGLLGQLVRGP